MSRAEKSERMQRLIDAAAIKLRAGRPLTSDQRADLDRKTRVEAIGGIVTLDNRVRDEARTIEVKGNG